MPKLTIRVLLSVVLLPLISIAQSPGSQTAGSPPQAGKTEADRPATSRAPKLTPEQKFVQDAVQTAVALPARDPQDRLRVLATAAEVASTVNRAMARNLWREGVQIESELIRGGQKPAVSMMASGQADCAAALTFVENLPPETALQAEQSLIGAITSCPKQTLDPVSRKLDAALEKNVTPPRALLAAMQAEGPKSPWSQSHFDAIFKSLPDPQANPAEAENYAALYANMANEVEKSRAEKAGVQLLSWLGKGGDSPQRSRATNAVLDAMRQALGEEGLKRALESDVSANTAARKPAPAESSGQPVAKGTSVLDAMRDNGSDQSERLRDLPPEERARAAAAHGFAVATSGDKGQAGRYFDMAFAAADDAWDARTEDSNAAAVVQEVGEAAAQVDSVNAMARAQKLRDPSAQAIAMLAVARVVASGGLAMQSARPHR